MWRTSEGRAPSACGAAGARIFTAETDRCMHGPLPSPPPPPSDLLRLSPVTTPGYHAIPHLVRDLSPLIGGRVEGQHILQESTHPPTHPPTWTVICPHTLVVRLKAHTSFRGTPAQPPTWTVIWPHTLVVRLKAHTSFRDTAGEGICHPLVWPPNTSRRLLPVVVLVATAAAANCRLEGRVVPAFLSKGEEGRASRKCGVAVIVWEREGC